MTHLVQISVILILHQVMVAYYYTRCFQSIILSHGQMCCCRTPDFLKFEFLYTDSYFEKFQLAVFTVFLATVTTYYLISILYNIWSYHWSLASEAILFSTLVALLVVRTQCYSKMVTRSGRSVGWIRKFPTNTALLILFLQPERVR